MDKTKELNEMLTSLAADVSMSAAKLSSIRDELVPPLEKELNDAKLRGGAQTTESDILREYIQVARKMQKLLFDNVYTHILTIERLSDHILCRRAVLERDKKPVKVVKEPPATNIFEKLQAATAGMSTEEIEAYLKKLRGE